MVLQCFDCRQGPVKLKCMFLSDNVNLQNVGKSFFKNVLDLVPTHSQELILDPD